jgi:hypothetical protein
MRVAALAISVGIVACSRPALADDPAESGPLHTMVTPATEEAVAKGLAYLRAAQNDDGSWPGGHPTASTATAMLAFMVTGRLPDDGDDAERLGAGLSYLKKLAEANDGYMGTGNKGMYEHALATLALAEAVGQADAAAIGVTLRAAVGVIVDSQNQKGGWRYVPEDNAADLSVTAMQVVALVAASEAGVAVPAETMQRARAYVSSCFNQQQGGFAYQPRRAPGFASAASGAAAMMFLAGADHDQARAAIDFLNADRERAEKEKFFFYGHYYAAQCMYRAGPEQHASWYPFVRDMLLKRQGGDGAWNSNPGGKTYATAMAIIILGADYHYLPIYQR